MRRIGIIGGETHIGEVSSLKGAQLDIVGAHVRPDLAEWAGGAFGCPLFGTVEALLDAELDIVAVANENDRKAEAVVAALEAGCDVIVDKPVCITMSEQEQIEAVLRERPSQRLLNLLTLRGSPPWMALRHGVAEGLIGTPAFTHVRMAVRLKRDQRPPWFLDFRRSGGLFLDLLIHGLDQVEWLTGRRIVALTANQGNLGFPDETTLRNHAAVYCELDDGSAAVVEGQRMLPDTKGSDYRVMMAGTQGVADLCLSPASVTVSSPAGGGQPLEPLPEAKSVVADWLAGGELIAQTASLRANRLALLATTSAQTHCRVEVGCAAGA